MPYTIEVKILPATNHKPTRIKATWGLVSHVMSYNYTFNIKQNMLLCAIELRKKYAPSLSKKYAPSLSFKGMGMNHKGIWTIVTR